MILLLPPHFTVVRWLVEDSMKRNGMTHSEEIEPKAGCRRFRLTRETDERRQTA